MTITGRSVISGTSPPSRLSLFNSMNVCCTATVINAYYTKVRGDLDGAVATRKGLFGSPSPRT